jgi:non-homologous end joining protein Ku
MAPRANWKGFSRLSLVTCPVALYPATSDSEKISFNQINKKTGHRIRYMRVATPSCRLIGSRTSGWTKAGHSQSTVSLVAQSTQFGRG